MATKRPRKRTGAKIATKKEQTELFERARRLAEDPSPLVPSTAGPPPGIVKRLARRLDRVARAAGNEKRLRWHMRFGPEVSRAYANLLLVGHSGKAGRMASFPTPAGDMKYAVRGMVPRHASVAVQHFRHPQVRVLGYREIAKKANGVIWATEEGVALTRGREAPPAGWFEVAMARSPVELQRDPEDDLVLTCPHLPVESEAERSPLALEVRLAQGPTRFRVCGQCVRTRLKDPGSGLLTTLASLAQGLRPRQIAVALTGTPRHCQHEDACAWERTVPTVPESLLVNYRQGRRGEHDILDRLLPVWEDQVRAADTRLLVAGDQCYGSDEKAFLDAVGETGERRMALERFLAKGPLVLIAKEPTLNQVLEACWSAAPAVLSELHPDTAALEDILARHVRSPPSIVLDEVLEARRARSALQGYPRYAKLPLTAGVADRLARAHRTDGAAGLAAVAEKELDRSTHKGLLWAALRITGQEGTQAWRFQKTDMEAGEFLEGPLRELLDSSPEEYHDRLARIHTLAGGQGAVPPAVGKI